MMKNPVRVLLIVLFVLLLSACNSETASETEANQVTESLPATATATTEPTATAVPPTETPEPTETPIPPTNTPEPTETPEPTATPIPVADVVFQIASEFDNAPVEVAELILDSAEFDATTTSDADGMAIFEAVPESEMAYELSITADGFKPYSDTIEVSASMEVMTATLVHDLQLEVVVSSINARSGPGTAYGVIATVEEGDTFEIIGRNASGSWYQIAVDDEAAWVSSSTDYVATSGNVEVLEVVDAPAAAPSTTTVSDDPPAPAADNDTSQTNDDASNDDEAVLPDTVVLFYLSNPSDVLGTFPLQPFDASKLYNQMVSIRSNLETMRNSLSGARDGDASACTSYVSAYNNILYGAIFFGDVPPAWQEISFLYELSFIYALDRSRPAYFSCLNAGKIDEFNYSLAFSSIEDALRVLNPIIDRAAASAGQ
jgi:uncharacterized protein YraI